MNIEKLYLFLAQELTTFVTVQNRYSLSLTSFGLRTDISAPERDYFTFLTQQYQTKESSCRILTGVDNICYGLVSSAEALILLGPVRLSGSLQPIFPILHDDRNSYQSSDFTSISVQELSKKLSLLHNVVNDDLMSDYTIYQQSFDSFHEIESAMATAVQTVFDNVELNQKHNPYDAEQHLMMGIESGDVEQVKASWEIQTSGRLGMTTADPIRNGKNLANAVITLASRAAIRGGVHYETAFSTCDAYIKHVEELKDMSNLENFIRECELTFARMVADLQDTRKATDSRSSLPIIDNAKNYIYAHLHERLTVQDIAANLHVNANYLSNLFKKIEGLSLYQYITKQKIKQVQSLLIFTSQDFIDIANYFGFSSQSHLSAVFKKQTGYTLKAYRDNFQKRKEY